MAQQQQSCTILGSYTKVTSIPGTRYILRHVDDTTGAAVRAININSLHQVWILYKYIHTPCTAVVAHSGQSFKTALSWLPPGASQYLLVHNTRYAAIQQYCCCKHYTTDTSAWTAHCAKYEFQNRTSGRMRMHARIGPTSNRNYLWVNNIVAT